VHRVRVGNQHADEMVRLRHCGMLPFKRGHVFISEFEEGNRELIPGTFLAILRAVHTSVLSIKASSRTASIRRRQMKRSEASVRRAFCIFHWRNFTR
jgi:hypothetical protein